MKKLGQFLIVLWTFVITLLLRLSYKEFGLGTLRFLILILWIFGIMFVILFCRNKEKHNMDFLENKNKIKEWLEDILVIEYVEKRKSRLKLGDVKEIFENEK